MTALHSLRLIFFGFTLLWVLLIFVKMTTGKVLDLFFLFVGLMSFCKWVGPYLMSRSQSSRLHLGTKYGTQEQTHGSQSSGGGVGPDQG
jgi:hypothetical protein